MAEGNQPELSDPEKAALLAVQKELVDCNPDRLKLQALWEQSLKEIVEEALVDLEQALPHSRGDNSPNDLRFKQLRHRILDCGGRLKREIPRELGCYVIRQVIERQVVSRVRLPGHGPLGLAGCRMPERRETSG